MKVLLEGPPRVGKTTVIRGLVSVLRDEGRSPAGFITHEICERRQRVGFALETFNGQRGLLAHIDLPGPPRVGRYGVDLAVVDRLAVPAVETGAGLTVIDEIATMALASAAFCRSVEQLFDSPANVAATVHVAQHPVTNALRTRGDVQVLEVTAANRERLAGFVLRLLSQG